MISAYTPSNTDPRLLKRVFVQREQLLARIVDRLTVSMTTGDKHHLMLVGPRGSGKTHLVTLAHWELIQDASLRDKMRIAWLGEDDTFSGLIHFAFGIARALANEYPDEFPEDFKSPVRGLSHDDAALTVLNTVIKNLKNRNLLLITENLNQTFQGLGDEGQQKLRAFLQETRRIATLVSTQQLFDAVTSRDKPFFGFFDILHLEPLGVDDAQQLILNIAREQGRKDLVEFLQSNKARYRIRALHHLAGGNHRMYVLLAEFLTQDKLDDLVSAFENLAEEMTPYFQERMRSLPDQQRQLVQSLCDAQGAMTVKQLAEETFIAEGNCSKQLGNLKAKAYVRSEKRGKETYYDMAEPLMRLCLEVKNQRGRPLRLVASFLKAWFPEERLLASVERAGSQARLAEYCQLALQSAESIEAIINANLEEAIEQRLSAKDWSGALELAEELSVSDRKSGLYFRLKVLASASRLDEALAVCNDLLVSGDTTDDEKATALLYRGWTYGQLGDSHTALADFTTVIQIPDAPMDLKAAALLCRAVAYSQLDDTQSELADYTAVIQMPGASADRKAEALVNRGWTFGQLGNSQGALADHTAVIEMPDAPADRKAMALVYRGVVRWKSKDWHGSRSDFEAALAQPGVLGELRTGALFSLPETLVLIEPLASVVAALTTAFETGDKASEHYGGTPGDLISMILQRGPLEWPSYVNAIAPLYLKHGVAEKLGRGITQSIRFLDEGDFSSPQLDLWYQAWQRFSEDSEDLQIPLQCLCAAIEVLKSDPPNDRPLFGLPLEIRQLIRPLLRNKLGEE